MKDRRRYFIGAAAKTLDVLESFTDNAEQLSITEIAKRAELSIFVGSIKEAISCWLCCPWENCFRQRGNAKHARCCSPTWISVAFRRQRG